jgi:hypothetical protein
MRFGFPPNSNVSREIVGVVGDVRDVAISQNSSASRQRRTISEDLAVGNCGRAGR